MRRHKKEDCKREILRGNKEESKSKRDTEIEIPKDNKEECKRERKERYVETKKKNIRDRNER